MASWGIIQHLSDQLILLMPTAAIVMELLPSKKSDTSIAMFLFKPFIVIFKTQIIMCSLSSSVTHNKLTRITSF